MRATAVLGAVAAMALLATGCSVTIGEGHFFHPVAAKPLDVTRWKLPAGVTAAEEMFDAPDGTRLHAVRITRPDAKADVLYFGGNVFVTDTAGEMIAAVAASLPVNMLMVDYRGYGRSEGKPTIDALASDSLAAVDYLRGKTTLPIIVHGFSLGSFIGAHAATERNVEGLVLESTATTVEEWAALNAPSYVKVKIADRLRSEDNARRVMRYRGGLLLVVGEKDRVTPASMSRKLFDAAALSPWKRLIVAPGKDHGDAITADAALAAYRELIASVSR